MILLHSYYGCALREPGSAGCRWHPCLFRNPDGLAALEADSPPIGGRFTEDAATFAHGFDGRHQRLTLGFLFVLPNLVTRLSLRLRHRPPGPPLCFSRSFPLIHTQKILLTAIHRRGIARQPDCIHLVIIQRPAIPPQHARLPDPPRIAPAGPSPGPVPSPVFWRFHCRWQIL